ncbi:MAG TPA: ferredoxin reductase [Nevskiaceae bacterium]|nr:ferredoxin reductase [Nevskiaceae bacterium]
MTSATARLAASLQEALRPVVRPSVFDFWARELGTTASHERVMARVVAKRGESRRAVTLELAPNRRFAGFVPGQHVNVTVDVEGRRLTRSYSLTGIPQADGRLSITVQQVEGGEVSAHLFSKLAVGDFVELGSAFGDMTLPATLDGSLLFLAAGSGITPLMSLTRDLAARGMPVPTTLVYWARHRADLCFVDELKALAAREPNFTFRIALTGDAVTATDELRGRPSKALLRDAVGDLAAHAVYACGPAGFVAEVESLCAATARSFQAEAFTPPTFTPSTEGAKVTVQLAKSGKTVTVASGQPLLAALEAAGVKPASGCRMGICNTCACRKLDGTTRDLKNGDESRGADPNLRICISSAQTDVSLDL